KPPDVRLLSDISGNSFQPHVDRHVLKYRSEIRFPGTIFRLGTKSEVSGSRGGSLGDRIKPEEASMRKTALLGCLAIAVCCPILSAQGKQAPKQLPAGEAKSIVETACTACHALDLITSAQHTPADWKLLVERMVAAGADVPKNKMQTVT